LLNAECQNYTISDCVWIARIYINLPLSLSTKRHTIHTCPYQHHTFWDPLCQESGHLKTIPFGCRAHVYDHLLHLKKSSSRAIRGIFVADMQKTFWVYPLMKSAIVYSIHVKCDVNSNMSNSFQAEGEIHFLHDSLRSTFQRSILDDTILQPGSTHVLPTTSSTDIPDVIPCFAACSNNTTSSSSQILLITLGNTIPFPSDVCNAEPGTRSDPGGVTENEEAKPSGVYALL
jgi:hypothetical protein